MIKEENISTQKFLLKFFLILDTKSSIRKLFDDTFNIVKRFFCYHEHDDDE